MWVCLYLRLQRPESVHTLKFCFYRELETTRNYIVTQYRGNLAIAGASNVTIYRSSPWNLSGQGESEACFELTGCVYYPLFTAYRYVNCTLGKSFQYEGWFSGIELFQQLCNMFSIVLTDSQLFIYLLF